MLMDSVKKYSCPNCNAKLEFNPLKQNWICQYCSVEYNREQVDAANKHEEELDQEMPELDSYTCSACGAELIADSTTSATFCLYCKNPTIIKTRFSGKFKPKSVIPFRLTGDQAKELYKKWIKRRLFAPDIFKQKEEIDKVSGIYAPFWLFDCTVDGTVMGEATRVKSWSDGKYRYTQTKYYNVTRKGKARYNRVPVDASKKLDDKFMHMIEPFDYNDITDFSMKYMSGFLAEKYDVESSEAESIMKSRVEGYLEERLKGTVNGYSSFSISNSQIFLSQIMQSYSMLPIYLLINKYKGKEHIFIVNGQTGKVVGNTPISHVKQILFGLATFIVALIIAVFGGALFV
jgi:DNA-directed RNA polymerase subunit RPC12/RpoP